ncbi:MAG TPA: hypothetical protein VFS67_07510 [Polyangiaceae bacterium]|nr:hypothetical protein [Polyangiaceae bacterium]
MFNANNFVSTLTARWNEQKNCELRGGSGSSNCTAEQHVLTFKSSKAGACDTSFTFDAKSTSGGNLAHPDQLENKLMFVGGSSNPYLAFSSTGTTVSIDPTYGLDEDPSTATRAAKPAFPFCFSRRRLLPERGRRSAGQRAGGAGVAGSG